MSSLQALLNPMSSGPPSPVALVGVRPLGPSPTPPPELLSRHDFREEEAEDTEMSTHIGPSNVNSYYPKSNPGGDINGVNGVSDGETEVDEDVQFEDVIPQRVLSQPDHVEDDETEDDEIVISLPPPPQPHPQLQISPLRLHPSADMGYKVQDVPKINGYQRGPAEASPPVSDSDEENEDYIQIAMYPQSEEEASASPTTDTRPPTPHVNEPSTTIHDRNEPQAFSVNGDEVEDFLAAAAAAPSSPSAGARLDFTPSPEPELPAGKRPMAAKAKRVLAAPRKQKGIARPQKKKRKVEDEMPSDDVPLPPTKPKKKKPSAKKQPRASLPPQLEQKDETASPSPEIPDPLPRRPRSKPSRASSIATHDEDGAPLYCICRKPDTGKWMIGCDGCEDWFHGECINVLEADGELIDKYYCPRCTTKTETTTWKRKCRLASCRRPAAVHKKPPSKYCTPEHGVEFFELETLRSTLSREELSSIMAGVTTYREFRELGDRIPTPPPSTSDAEDDEWWHADEIYPEEQKRLHVLADERHSLETDRKQIITQREQYLAFAKDRQKRIWEELKANPETASQAGKEICGFDERFTCDDSEWREWCESPEGKKVFEEGRIEGREGVCLRKSHDRHLRWHKVVSEQVALMERLRGERLVQLNDEEKGIRERIKRRRFRDEREGTVDVCS